VCLLLLLFVPKMFGQSLPATMRNSSSTEAYQDKKYDEAVHGFEQANKALGGTVRFAC